MTPAEIQNALGIRLSAMDPALPVVFPNKVWRRDAQGKPILPPFPYLVMQVVSRSDMDAALSGGAEYSTGQQVITVVSALDQFSNPADNVAARVKAAFPKALALDGIKIVSSQVLSGYATDRDWRVPVQVNWGP